MTADFAYVSSKDFVAGTGKLDYLNKQLSDIICNQ
jgi:hypothetical protein